MGSGCFCHSSQSSSSFLGWDYKNNSSEERRDVTNYQGSISDAMGDTRHKAGGDGRYIAARIKSEGKLYIEAEGDVQLLAAYDTEQYAKESSSSSFGSLLSEE